MNGMQSNFREASHSLPHKRAADDIKKGLQRIKQAQIQVLRQLRKQQPIGDMQHSLTYSKETTSDSRPVLKFDIQAALNREKLDRFHREIAEFNVREARIKKQCLTLTEQVKKYKQISQKAQHKLKQYQKSQQKALSKAQQAITNAINSQKKYILIKIEQDKTMKQRDNLSYELKRLQKKQLVSLMPNPSEPNEGGLPAKLVKEINAMYECFKELLTEVDGHRCDGLESSCKNNGKSARKEKQKQKDKNVISNASHPNSFTISTYQLQSNLNKHINNTIILLNNLNLLLPIHQSKNSQTHEPNNIHISGSFRQDIRNLQQQLQSPAKLKIQQQAQQIKKLEVKLAEIGQEVKEYKEENSMLRAKIKKITKQFEEVKIGKKVLEDQYERFKVRVKDREKAKNQEIQQLKKSQNQYRKELMATPKADKNLSNGTKTNNGNDSPERLVQILSSRVDQLQTQTSDLKKQRQVSKRTQQNLKQLIQNLKTQLQQTNTQKLSQQQHLTHQLLKTNAKATFSQSLNKKNLQQWQTMLNTIGKLQQQRTEHIQNHQDLTKKLEAETTLYKAEMRVLEAQVEDQQGVIEALRGENAGISYDQVELQRLRNQEYNREVFNYDANVDQLWMKKEEEYGNVNSILGQVNHGYNYGQPYGQYAYPSNQAYYPPAPPTPNVQKPLQSQQSLQSQSVQSLQSLQSLQSMQPQQPQPQPQPNQSNLINIPGIQQSGSAQPSPTTTSYFPQQSSYQQSVMGGNNGYNVGGNYGINMNVNGGMPMQPVQTVQQYMQPRWGGYMGNVILR